MFCYVTLPNSNVLEISVDPKKNGQECLAKVCEKLNIWGEIDYFGLQYQGSNEVNLWLNRRNPINKQLIGKPPYRFQLRVKFYVQPHLLLQDITKQLFYQQILQDLPGLLHHESEEKVILVASLCAQAAFGDQCLERNKAMLDSYKSLLRKFMVEPTEDLLYKIIDGHCDHKDMKKEAAEYLVLKEAAKLPKYGMEYYKCYDCHNTEVNVGVGPEGIFIYDLEDEILDSYPYTSFIKAVHDGRKCLLTVLQHTSPVRKDFRLINRDAANALYRCITEMNTFFCCDSVTEAVSQQVTPDLKTVLFSMFVNDYTNGNNFVFDVNNTFREVYDGTRRKLFRTSGSPQPTRTGNTDIKREIEEEDDGRSDKKKLRRIMDSFLCQVCMDQSVNVTFSCGHLCCCRDCSSKISNCPLCRNPIEKIQKIYLPTDEVCTIR